MPAADAFPGSVRLARFRSHCYAFHFPAPWGMRTWPQALAFCQQWGGSLASVGDEEENAFLAAVANLPGQCAVMSLHPSDLSRHGTWEPRGCDTRPHAEATGFFCKSSHGSCGPPAPVEFPLPGGMGPYATADVVFSMPCHAVGTVVLTKASSRAVLLQLRLESNATHVYGSLAAEFPGASLQQELAPVPFSAGQSTWGFITLPAGVIGFFNHQEHFRVASERPVSFASLGALLVSGVAVVNASLGERLCWGPGEAGKPGLLGPRQTCGLCPGNCWALLTS
nr:uncharacterized protein LOC112547247 [Pelodiscus sinensis]|eukprot:XP_025044872.1 uncharacterized protein LOC112547247 [Pelodiscus sinensis]